MLPIFSCNNPKTKATNSGQPVSNIPVISYTVPHYFPHDTNLYTEGFLFHNGELFESTGSPKELDQTESVIGIDNLTTGKFSKKIEIDKTKYFGEGIVFLNDKLYQLTYKKQLGFIYDANSFKKIGQFTYNNAEGWSLTTDGKNLIMSDGTNKLTYLNPTNLKPVRVLSVTNNGMPQDSLNELEYIKGFIYANVWMNNFIFKIDPTTGKIVGKLDLSLLAQDARNKNPQLDVLNGIAYDSTTDKIYVTGKLWPNIYQIDFKH
ncbi:MAG TPA: glutaminyl-peptide cyclotransferase [Hanamia sp.]|nr:glutaminyl-peptide cyclotransferase [Hanamia sp.]